MINIDKIGSSNMEIIRESFPEELEREYEKLLPLFKRYNFLVTSIHAVENVTSSQAKEESKGDEREITTEKQCVSASQRMLLRLRKRQTISKIEKQLAVINSLVDENGTPMLEKVGFSDYQREAIQKNLENHFYKLIEDEGSFYDKVFLEDVFSNYVDLLSSYLELKKSILRASLTMAEKVLSGDSEKVDLSIFDTDLDSQFSLLDERITSIIKRTREGKIMIYIDLKTAIEDLAKYNLSFSKVVNQELEDFDFDDLEGCLCMNHLFRKIYFSMGGEIFQSMALSQNRKRQEAVAEGIVQEMASGNVDIIDEKMTPVVKSDSTVQKKYS